MRKTSLWTTLFILPLLACATTQAIRPQIYNSATFSAPFDEVWSALISTLAEQALPIESVEKESGLITTKFVTFASGLLADERIDYYTVKPSGLLNVWNQGRYTISAFVTPSGEEAAVVRITTHIEAYESNVSKSWHVCYSKGVLEREIFNSIRSQINGGTSSTMTGETVAEQPTGGSGKIGVRFQNQVVKDVTFSGPAARAGVKVGDKILAANGNALNGVDSHDATLITGPPGTTVKLTIQRDGQIFEIPVVRE
jgi:hypothetical protein